MQKKYYGKETEKAKINFNFHSISPVHRELIYAIAEIKIAAAKTHKRLRELKPDIADAIVLAANEILTGAHDSQFILPGLQGGAGTSVHMNVNEVIASRAEEIAGVPVHPNDHVNKSQSTNDVNPSALRIVSIRCIASIKAELTLLIQSFNSKSREYEGVLKLGRTHLQDAVPLFASEEFKSHADLLERHIHKIESTQPFLEELNLGGTAIGTSINASIEYRRTVYEELRKLTNLNLKPSDNLVSQTSSQTDFLWLSQTITALCVDLSKIASDIRLLASGPFGGIGEYTLQELQSGSTIMPGKVNPVAPETVNQLYFFVSGNNLTIEHATHASQLQLGVMFPIVADRLISSLNGIPEVLRTFRLLCIDSIAINKDRTHELLEHSFALATCLSPALGYETVSAIVHEAHKSNKTLRQIVLEKKLLSEDGFDKIVYQKITNRKKV